MPKNVQFKMFADSINTNVNVFAEVVVAAVAEEEATLPSFMAHRYPSSTRRTIYDSSNRMSIKH